MAIRELAHLTRIFIAAVVYAFILTFDDKFSTNINLGNMAAHVYARIVILIQLFEDGVFFRVYSQVLLYFN